MRQIIGYAFALGLAVVLGGCGTADDFEAGNRLVVAKIADTSGSTAPVFLAVEKTDDSGLDGDPDTNDEGENDGFPDPSEKVEEGYELGPDLGVITVRNEARPGVKEGVPLVVYRVDITYLDATGASRAFAPSRTQWVNVEVDSGGSADIEVVLVPEDMKTREGGLRHIFLFGTEEQKAAVRTMTAVVDVYARDVLNDDSVHAQGRIVLTFINPMESAKPE